MKWIVCLSNEDGLSFNNRRQSRDEKVCEDMLKLCGGGLSMDSYSMSLFKDIECGMEVNLIETDTPQKGIYYFVERKMPDEGEDQVSELVIYRWGRDYPSDTFFTMDLNDFRRKELIKLGGSSHEQIEREIWVRKS